MKVTEMQIIILYNENMVLRKIYQQDDGACYACVNNRIIEVEQYNDIYHEVGLADIVTNKYDCLAHKKYYRVAGLRKRVIQHSLGIFFIKHKGLLHLVHGGTDFTPAESELTLGSVVKIQSIL